MLAAVATTLVFIETFTLVSSQALLGTLPAIPNITIVSAESSCQDTLTECNQRADKGECQTNPVSMLVECPLSCNSCLPMDRSECVDKGDPLKCLYSGLLGECIANPSYNLRFCSGSCKEHISSCRPENQDFGEPCDTPKSLLDTQDTDCGFKGAMSIARRRRRSGRKVSDPQEKPSGIFEAEPEKSRGSDHSFREPRIETWYRTSIEPLPEDGEMEPNIAGSIQRRRRDTPKSAMELGREEILVPRTPHPPILRQAMDPFSPFCDPEALSRLRAKLNSMIGRDTGRPLPDEVIPLVQAINYCQYGGRLNEEAARDVFNGKPPTNWRGLSTPSRTPPRNRRRTKRSSNEVRFSLYHSDDAQPSSSGPTPSGWVKTILQ